MHKLSRKALLIALCLLPSVATAAVYKYVDENGVTRYTDQPPANKPASKVDIKAPRQLTPAELEQKKANDEVLESKKLLDEANRKMDELKEEQARQERIRQQEEDNKKFTGCKLAEQLKTVSEGKSITQKLIDSASSNNFSTWRQPGGWVSTRILSYEPVCGNQTRYTITINDANFVWALKRDIAR